MMLRMTFVSGLAIVALAACGDDTGDGSGGAGGSGSTTTNTSTGTTSTTSTGDGGGTTSSGDGGGTTSSGDGGGTTSSGDGGAGGGGTAYDCASYCADVAEACTDDLAQYPSVESCEAACAAFETGEFQDTGNTLGCRAYHATAALDAPDVHCGHAGPLGTGACSADATSPCEAFCAVADTICPEAYADVGACEKVCAGFTAGDYNAGATPPEDDTLACRMYHLSVAAVSEDNAVIHCEHIGGESPTCPAP